MLFFIYCLWYRVGNMTENQTFQSENEQAPTPKDDGEIVSQAQIDLFNDWAASGAAQRIMEDTAETPILSKPTTSEAADYTPIRTNKVTPPARATVRGTKRTGIVVGTALAVGGTAGLAYAAANEALKTASFSEETTTYTVEPGDGLFSAIQHIEGIETINKWDAVEHVQSDPANIDILKDGLQPGEQLVVPVSVNGIEKTEQE